MSHGRAHRLYGRSTSRWSLRVLRTLYRLGFRHAYNGAVSWVTP